MVARAENISRTRAAATRRTIRASGRATADEITAAMNFLRRQPFIRPDRTLVVGHSAGGWGALALGEARGVSAIIVFAPGRGGHANDLPNQVCAPQALLASAAEFGKASRVPVTWLVAANDSYFSPSFSRRLAEAFRGSGGRVDFHELRLTAAKATGWWNPGRR